MPAFVKAPEPSVRAQVAKVLKAVLAIPRPDFAKYDGSPQGLDVQAGVETLSHLDAFVRESLEMFGDSK